MCLILTLTVIVVVVSRVPLFTHRRHKPTVLFVNGTSWNDKNDNIKTWASASVSRRPAAVDGRWYDFSHPPLFVFYVYSAFLVDHRPQHVIHLVSITSIVQEFAHHQTDVLCVVRYPDRNLTHVASILQRLPKLITEPDHVGHHEVIHAVGDYVYSCPLPAHQQHQYFVPVSIH